ncbi:MAG: hypothetical protein K6F99_07840, partial [Lachnospiraceae bacterium]|nr:hypothetical protein [Lachnospiraceae bacterium]
MEGFKGTSGGSTGSPQSSPESLKSGRIVYKNKDMEAYIVLKKPPKGVEYSRSDIANYMASNNLKA